MPATGLCHGYICCSRLPLSTTKLWSCLARQHRGVVPSRYRYLTPPLSTPRHSHPLSSPRGGSAAIPATTSTTAPALAAAQRATPHVHPMTQPELGPPPRSQLSLLSLLSLQLSQQHCLLQLARYLPGWLTPLGFSIYPPCCLLPHSHARSWPLLPVPVPSPEYPRKTQRHREPVLPSAQHPRGSSWLPPFLRSEHSRLASCQWPRRHPRQ